MAATLAAMCVLVAWSIERINGLAVVDETQQAMRQAALTAEALERHSAVVLDYVDQSLRSLRTVYDRGHDPADVRRFLDGAQFDPALVHDVAIVLPDGRPLLSTAPFRNAPAAMSEREEFRFQRAARADEPFFSAVEYDRPSSAYLFRVARRIANPDGSFGGIAVASVNPHALVLFDRDLRSGPQSMAGLIGTIDRKLRVRFPESSPERWLRAGRDSHLWAVLARSPVGTYDGVSGVDGVDRTYTYRKLLRYPLVAMVGISASDVRASIAGRLNRQTRFGVFALIAAVAFTLLVAALAYNRLRLKAAHADLARIYERVRDAALNDALTGLPNRTLFEDRLGQACLEAERDRTRCGVIYVDLDDFKRVNDTAGHDAGDRVLKLTAQRMVRAVRDVDTVSRRGGDEFVVLAPRVTADSDVFALAERLLACIGEPLGDGALGPLGASIGVAIFPDHAATAEDVIAAADAAMYRAKRAGKARVAGADPAPEGTL